ncbi:deacetylase [Lithospermum erythrorhizon]|uniref:Deacetylase n=1 Tax=Lithospermum erythrorhizon TaxID=34254 RepID=A0AAV3NJ59_LITER
MFERPVWNNPFLNIIETPNDSVKRDPEPRLPADEDPNGTSPVLSRDVTLDPTKKTWLRLYIPKQKDNINSSKLPLIVYYHGGGFIFSYADSFAYDVFCKGLVEKIGAMVISLDYSLAPENRLPAAYDDAMDCLFWIKVTQDKWVREFADFSNVFLCGTSAGGNLAYHAGLRGASVAEDLNPVKITGLILHHPYFSGSKRTLSEERLKDDPLLPLYSIDKMFDLCLPKGVDHDHEYCNPLANGGSEHIEKMKELGWRVLVSGCFDDPLVDAGIACAEMLEAKGIEVVRFFGDGYHAMEVFNPSYAPPFYDAIKNFISSST